MTEVWGMISNNEILEIPYNDAVEAAKDIVDLLYKNREYCQIEAVIRDLEILCGADGTGCLDDVDIWTNLRSNGLQIFSKVQALAEFFFNANSLTDDDIIRMCDQLGDSYGSILSMIIGFDKRFVPIKSLLV